MAKLKSTITLIDNFSATFEKLVRGADKATQSLETVKKQLEQQSDFAVEMRYVEQDMEQETQIEESFHSHINKVKELTSERNRIFVEVPQQKMIGDILPSDSLEQLRIAEELAESWGSTYAKQHQEVARLNQEIAYAENAVASLATQYAKYDAQSAQAFEAKADLEVNVKILEELKKERLKVQELESKAKETFERTGVELDKLRGKAEQLVTPVNNSTKAQKLFNKEIQQGEQKTNVLLNSLKGMFKSLVSFQGMKKGFAATIGASANLDQQVLTMQAAFGDTAIGEIYFNKMQDVANQTGHSMEELTDITRNFMRITKNTEKLQGLTGLAHRLSLKTSSIGSAEALIQEALQGQYGGLKQTLNLTDSQLAPLKEAVQLGNLDEIMGVFDQTLTTAGLTKAMVEAFENSPLQKFNRVVSKFKLKFAESGQKALEILLPLLNRIDEWLQKEQAQMFFNTIAYGLAELANGVMFLLDLVKMHQEPILTFLITVGALLMTHVVKSILIAAASFLQFIWPILLISGIITLVIQLFQKLGVTFEDIAGVAGRVIGFLYAIVQNRFAEMYNIIASVAEFLMNVWNHPIHVAKEVLVGFFDRILADLQRVAEAWDWVFRTNTSQKIQGWRDDLKASIEERPEGYKVIERMEKISIENAMQKGFEIGSSLPGNIANGISKVTNVINNTSSTEVDWNARQYDTLSSINNNTTKTGEEDLKWLRDAAEHETINRFTTATVAPQINIEFGDVKETADVDGIVRRLTEMLSEQINVAAEGVHP